MSNDTDKTSLITLDDLTYFWMPNGAPCFIANNYDVVDDFCETVESFGFQIYYVITDKETSKTVQAKDSKGVMTSTEVYEYTPAVLKVVNNFTGRAIMDSPDSFGTSFVPVQETAEYKMPLIPRVIVDKLDEFFRLVDAQHKTESIVILTYDQTKQGSDGWGVLVPEQQNTSVHCKYDADSIAALKPDHVMIVGSVHSHPDMPAYASGTDHADQADFDGIHITYGWQKSVSNGATQYHIELQIGGANYTLKPEDVFEGSYAYKDPDPEVIAWSSKVKKALPPYTGVAHTQALQQQNTNHQTQVQDLHKSETTTPGINTFERQSFFGKLTDIEPDAIVAMELDGTTNPDSDCLMCTFPLTKADMSSGYCMTCGTPIITSDLNHIEILELLHLYCLNQKIDPTVAYYVYCTDDSAYNNNFVINIKPAGQDPKLLGSETNSIDSDDSSYYDLLYTLCCSLPYSMIESCTCPVTVIEENISHFDVAHRDMDIYDGLSIDGKSCFDCQYYYQTECPSFKNAIVDYMTNDKKVTQSFSVCNTFVNYKEVNEKTEYTNYGAYYD